MQLFQSTCAGVARSRRICHRKPAVLVLNAKPLSTYAYRSPLRAKPITDLHWQRRNMQLPSCPSASALGPVSTTTPLKRNYSMHSPQMAVPPEPSTEPTIHAQFENKTGTWQYVVADASTSTAVIIDPVLDFDPVTQVISTNTADSLLALVKEKGYTVSMILETHAHADHITAASYLQARLNPEQGYQPPIGIGERIEQVQRVFGERYGVSVEEYRGVFGKLFKDDETFAIGDLTATAIHLPGHTPDHMGYKIGDNIFCGDSLFHPDIGTARCDFPGGSAESLFNSGRRLLELPDQVKIWVGHDYPPEKRSAPVPCMTVADHKQTNLHLKLGVSQNEFVTIRNERDAGLAAPRLLHASLQMNIRAGRLPWPTDLGLRMLHLPLKLDGVNW